MSAPSLWRVAHRAPVRARERVEGLPAVIYPSACTLLGSHSSTEQLLQEKASTQQKLKLQGVWQTRVSAIQLARIKQHHVCCCMTTAQLAVGAGLAAAYRP